MADCAADQDSATEGVGDCPADLDCSGEGVGDWPANLGRSAAGGEGCAVGGAACAPDQGCCPEGAPAGHCCSAEWVGCCAGGRDCSADEGGWAADRCSAERVGDWAADRSSAERVGDWAADRSSAERVGDWAADRCSAERVGDWAPGVGGCADLVWRHCSRARARTSWPAADSVPERSARDRLGLDSGAIGTVGSSKGLDWVAGRWAVWAGTGCDATGWGVFGGCSALWLPGCWATAARTATVRPGVNAVQSTLAMALRRSVTHCSA
jgi:hypothetical protein